MMKTMTDEKMIEEMAKDIFESKVAIDGSDMSFGLFDEDDHFHRIARFLYKHNYRKIPENAVVIPEKITEETSPEDIIKIAKYNESVRKETAREIIEKLFSDCNISNDNDVIMIWQVKNILKKLAKKCGVEVEE